MDKNDILEAIKSLASSQGFYSGLYTALSRDTKEAKDYLNFLEKKDFRDIYDLIMYFEG